jgi:hypothetical protein
LSRTNGGDAAAPDYAYRCRQHPHLRPALDIPYCHHENGMAAIRAIFRARSIAARLLQWWMCDALTSDRPYCPAA